MNAPQMNMPRTSQDESVRYDADSTIQIVSFADVEFIDEGGPNEFDVLTHARRRWSARRFPASFWLRASWLRSSLAFVRGLVVIAGTTFARVRVRGKRVASTFRGLVGTGIRRGNVLASHFARRPGSKVVSARMSADEIARLNVVAAFSGSTASGVVRTLVLQEYQKLAGTRRQRAPTP